MRILLLALGLTTLVGCSAPSMTEMRSEGDAKTYKSGKSEGDLAKCILFAWQDTSLAGGNAQAYVQPGRSGGTTVYTQGNEYFVDLAKNGVTTKVDYFEVGDTWISRKLKPGVEGCL